MGAAKKRDYIITSQKVLTPDEETRLRAVCARYLKSEIDRRNSALLLLLLDLGVRANEILAIRVKDFDFDTYSVYIRALKGSRDRELPVRPSLAKLTRKVILEHYGVDRIEDVDGDMLIFNITYHRLYQLWQVYTPNPKKTIHSTRHTFAMNLYGKCKDIRTVQVALGHKSILSTMVYMDFFISQNALRDLICK